MNIPIELMWNHVIVKTRINDGDPHSLLLDTGAQLSAVDEPTAEGLGIEGLGEFQGRGAGEGSTTAHLATGVSFRLPGVEISNQTVGILPLGERLSKFTGRPLHGVLGYDFTSRFVVDIDYASRTLSLHDPKTFDYAGNGDIVPISLHYGIPAVRATIKPFGSGAIEGTFLVDTGASDALYLTRPFVEAHRLLDTLIENVRVTVPGVGGESLQNVGRVEKLQFGGQRIDNPVAFFAHDRAGAFANPDFAGIIGAEILRRYRVLFDYTNGRMILERNDRFAEPYEFDKSGIMLQAEGLDYRTYRIHAIIDQSPAEEAGLRPGDVLVEIDGRPAGELSLVEISAELFRNGRTLSIRVQRGEELVDVGLTLRRLV
jgi:hypothetical protein